MSEPRRIQLSDFEKGQINGLKGQNFKIAAIARAVQRPWQTVADYVKREKERGTHKNLSRSGRPPALDVRTERRLIREAKSIRDIPLAEINANICPNVSRRTMKRYLAKHNLKKWRAAEQPLLKAEHAQARLEWAILHRDWTEEDWERVIWSDECKVERGSDSRTVWVFRTPKEKWEKDCIVPKHKGKTIGAMVWACFHSDIRGPFVPLIMPSINAEVYLAMLKVVLPSVAERVQELTGRPAIFMQDNAPIHRAHIVTEWFKSSGIQVMKWPPYSPDLNPIEHCWKRLKEKLQTRYPDIATMLGGKPAIQLRLRTLLPKVWDEIEGQYLKSLCTSMCSRVNAVIQAKGWYTKY